jgi:DNA-binding transcriptional MerR regulator
MATRVETPPAPRRMTIGAVCDMLRPEFTDLSISKIRYLEDQGLIEPHRTRGGYRLFSESDVERLRRILTLQRDAFLPLRVIRDELERAPEAPATTAAAPRRRRTLPRGTVGPTREELERATGASPELLAELEEFSLVAEREGRFRPEDEQIVAAAVGLNRYGVGARALRAIHSAIQREAGLLEQLLAPSLRSRNPERQSAGLEDLETLAGFCADLTEAVLQRDLGSGVPR